MLTVYIVSAIIAGALILLSALGGDHDAGGHDADVGGHEIEVGGHDVGHHELDGTWIPFFSLRFWTYFAASFGLIGLLLTVLNAANPMTALIVSLIAGLGTGLGVAALMQWLKKSSMTSSSSIQELLGKEGKVLVGARALQMGKIRVENRGEFIDLLVVAEEGQVIEPGERVYVVSVEGDQARVARPRDVLGE